MSYEFGSYNTCGYFHNKIGYAAEDAREGRWKVTKMLGKSLIPLSDLALRCSAVEADDSSIEHEERGENLDENIEYIEDILKKLKKIRRYFRDIKEGESANTDKEE